ncbi:putative bifunctional diguanylate cyclase/phosphodiesterase [Thiohalobacter thiocyanaticus]|uniref:cyclic-guanylate-specific phosphodiesterase n=1 Tax=Thiohalobacter thiocyanaticus TaxID=585455 RepID=A0A426QIW9_9GAMM|nr:GGDEF domain-containing phosphodiesterase [Thiohalobacter thiocyanaticus]RRQ21711.1 EAL domain-containing protein [Thiohalobacter thiocyanaticus]
MNPDTSDDGGALAHVRAGDRGRDTIYLDTASNPKAHSLYLRNVGIAFLLVGTASLAQMAFVYESFQPHLFVIPALVALAIAFLLARVSLLKAQVQRESGRFRAVADVGQEFTYFCALDGSYEYASPSSVKLTGYRPEEFYAKPGLMAELIHPLDRERWQQHVAGPASGRATENLDLRLIHKDGHTVWFQHICGPVHDAKGRLVGIRAANIDITERKEFEARIERMAYYDPLTDLPNRRALNGEIEQLIRKYPATENRFAVLFLDLDRFKHINDSYGHELGDQLLVKLAERLRRCCENQATISRFGGDELVVVVPDVDSPKTAVDYAAHLLDSIERPFILEDRELYISGGIGVTLYPYDGQDAATLIRNADAAMYRAKQTKHTRIGLYSEELIDNIAAFVSTENRIRRALKEHEFVPHYQPQVDMNSGRIVGAEALARWHSHDRGLISPAEFIPVAEETGLIDQLGRSILTQACAQILEWQRSGIRLPVSVNISGRQFAIPGFVDQVQDIIAGTGIDPAQLELEITEQVFLEDMDEATDKLWQLRDLGVSIAIDDFGIGYSSLSYLKRLPFNTLKIDRAFTRDICDDARDVAILRAILSLSRDLRLNTIIEGVETEAQKKLLLRLGCERAQGFLFHQPLPAAELTPLLVKR